MGGGFSILNNSWGGGITLSSSEGFTIDNFVDLNGDGLPDLVRQIKNENGGKIAYRLNTSTGFEPNEHIIDDAYIQFNRGTGQGLNISFTYGFTPILLPIKFTTTITAAGNLGLDRVERTITDINGDGYADILYTPSDGNDGDLKVRLNKTGKAHLLRRVNLPLGGHWEIDYEREQNSYEMPNAKWKMTAIEVYDGFTGDNAFTPDIAKTSVEYTNPRHDRREREFMGYGEVRVNQLDVKNSDEIFRYSLQEFHTNSYYLKGAVKKESLYDKTNVLWTSTETTYAIMTRGQTNPGTVVKPSDYTFGSADFNTPIDKASLFVSPVKTTKTFIEVDSGSKTTFTEIQAFDPYGNITQYKDNGEGGDDAVTTVIQYYTGYDQSYFKGYPRIMTVMSPTGILRQREAYYNFDSGTANLDSIKIHLTGSEKSTVSFDYDAYGNIEKVTHEESKDENGDPFYYEYTYDNQLHTYPVHIEDAFGYSSNNTYDYRFGALVYTEDMNYMPMRTRIDNRGRVVEITGPYELFVEGLTTGDPAWTIRFEYEGEATVASRVANIEFTDYLIDAIGKFEPEASSETPTLSALHHAVTRHFDPEFRTDPETPLTENEIYTITLIDGLGKPIQVKKSTSIKTAVTNHTGDITKTVIDARDTRKWLINGKVETDAFGRAVKTWYPILEDYNVSNPFNTAALSYNAAAYETGENFYTEATYDVLDRVKTTKLPGETAEMTTAYSIESSLFKTTVVNELGQTKHSFTDVRGRTTKVVEESTGGNIETTFEYNALGELLKVKDTGGNETLSKYDMAGRRTELRHPDNGITKFTYDNASNLIAKETANLLAENNAEKIEYFYTFNRLDSIVYPRNPYNNVHFFYGEAQDASAADDFSVGRLWYQIDATGVQQFKYGRLGEVTYNLRSVAVPGDKAYWFKTEWEYDTWNRVKKISYPDEEEVTYFYNRGGELHGITSKKQSQQNADIISQLGYDKFGQRTYLRYGNGTETEYSYEDNRRRLLNMTAKSNTTYGSSVNRTFINNNYSYDVLSNVLSVQNTAALPTTGQIGGSVLYEYEYDDLNRLKNATGNFIGRNSTDTGNEYQKYTLAMAYDNMHNILSKNQIHETSPDNTNWTKAHQTTYDLTYEKYNTAEFNVAGYSYTQPHAVRQIIDKPEATSTGNDVKTKMYDYDPNGNLTNITQKTGESDVVEKLRTNLWDEENRLRAVDITPDAEGIRPIAIYTYDAGGERILKHSNTSVSIYLNGKKVADTIQTDATLYPSGMLVAKLGNNESEEEQTLAYTKHYYAGTQRVSSKIGTTENLGDYLYDWFTQGTGGPVDVIGSSFGVLENAENGVVQVYDELGIEPPTYDSDPVFIPVASFIHGGNEIEQYYFHPDHLGSTSYITNLLGEVSQHIEYFAFGETFVEEHRSSNNSPYKFNGKELDEETGWYYYGARYYDPRISVWLSVDPPIYDGTYLNFEHDGGFANSFNHNSFSYCRQNPVLYIDPDGNQYVHFIHINQGGKWETKTVEYYKMSKAEIRNARGTYQGSYNSASYGPEGKGVKHTFVYGSGHTFERWDFKSNYSRHGLYSGSGSIRNMNGVYDFSFQPVDIADAIAKRHDMDYYNSTKSGNYLGYVEDTRTLSADYDMVFRVDQALNIIGNGQEISSNMIPGIEEAFREGTSGEMNIALIGQRFVIGSLRDYKQWKVDNKINGSIMDKNVYKAYKNHAGAIQAKMIRKMEKDRLKDK
ncbi:MAG: RHS repeat-associated core domain-containing protein [Weeksellaceae bacterium]